MSDELPNLSDTEREAVVWKLARDAEAQFWRRLSAPIVRGLSVIAVMLAILGISGYALIPSWIDSQARANVKNAIDAEFASQNDQAKMIREATLTQLTETRYSAEQSRQAAQILVTQQKTELERLINEQRTEVERLREQTLALKRKADAIQSIAKITDLEAFADLVSDISALADKPGVKDISAFNSELVRIGKSLEQLTQRSKWTEIELVNRWRPYSQKHGYNPPAYSVSADGTVRLRGLIAGGNSNENAFILPAALAPEDRHMFGVLTYPDVPGRIDIFEDGAVRLVFGNTGWVSLDGITFTPKIPSRD